MTDSNEKHYHEDGPFNYCPVKGCDWTRAPEETATQASAPLLTFDELRVSNDKRARIWNASVPPPLSFCMMELAGEAGEACNVAKKLARHEMGMPGGSEDIDALADELADVVICTDLAASRAGIDLGLAVARKVNRTSRKHGFDVFLAEDAQGGEA